MCHPELTRKLVELAKRNFLFLLGVSGSIYAINASTIFALVSDLLVFSKYLSNSA